MIAISAMILGSGSAIVALGGSEARVGLLAAVTAIGLVLLVVSRRTRRQPAGRENSTDRR